MRSALFMSIAVFLSLAVRGDCGAADEGAVPSGIKANQLQAIPDVRLFGNAKVEAKYLGEAGPATQNLAGGKIVDKAELVKKPNVLSAPAVEMHALQKEGQLKSPITSGLFDRFESKNFNILAPGKK